LAALGNERANDFHVLIVDVVDFVCAELADLPTPEQRAPLALGAFLSGLFIAAASACTAATASLSKWHV
jgi:hypothetical protein